MFPRKIRESLRAFAPPPKMTVSEWADTWRYLPPESSADPGKWKTSKTPWLKEPMDAWSDDRCEEIVLLFSAQMAKTEWMTNCMFYSIHHDPASMLLINPTSSMAKAYAQDRFEPSVRDTEPMRRRIKEDPTIKKESAGKDQILYKRFPGGRLTMIGANSPSELAARPIRYVLGDEIDRWQRSVGKKGQVEGDPYSLATARQKTFFNRKRGVASTPTVEGISRIDELYEDTDQCIWELPCPHCEEYQVLQFANLLFKDEAEGRSESMYACEHCGALFSHAEKLGAMVRLGGRWLVRKPEITKRRGFHVNELSSPWRSFDEIVEDFRKATKEGPETLRTFVNTVLGQVWRDKDGEKLDATGLKAREEPYDAEVPFGALYLTAAVDMQKDRLEMMVMGHGLGNQRYFIKTVANDGHVITPIQVFGSPADPATWKQLDPWLTKDYHHASGRKMRISMTLIDTGGLAGHADMAYKYAKQRESWRVFCSKGSSVEARPLASKPTENNNYRAKLFSIGTDTAKTQIFDSLSKVVVPGPGYYHFPEGLDQEFYDQLTSERPEITFKRGKKVKEWKKRRERNEVLDLTVLNLAAAGILDVRNLQQMAEALARGIPTGKPKRKRGKGVMED